MISYLSSKAFPLSNSLSSFATLSRSSAAAAPLLLRRRLRCRNPKFPIRPRACHGAAMDSPPPDVDSVARDLRNQSLRSDDDSGDASKLSLEDLNWDHSFVRALPGDPRSDSIPREVRSLFLFFFLSGCRENEPRKLRIN